MNKKAKMYIKGMTKQRKGKKGKKENGKGKGGKGRESPKIMDASVRRSETGCPSTRATKCTILKGRSQVE